MSKTPSLLNGENGIELASLEWLSLHHRVKAPERQQILKRFDIREGDRVLDLGCGPGFWVEMLADIVGKSGAVVGADFDEGLIHHAAKTIALSRPDHDIAFKCISFEEVGDMLGTFDVIFFSNCFCYVPDPQELLRRLAVLVRPGGRVIGRNWDGGVFILNPIPEVTLARMQHLLAEVFDTDRAGPYFDNYFGRKLPGTFRRHGFKKVTGETQVIERWGPADADLSAYIKANGAWWEETVSHKLTPTERDEWRRYFDERDERYVCRSEDFYFCMLEAAVTGYV